MKAKPQSEHKISEKQWLLKAAAWCAYQERSQHELRNKLDTWSCPYEIREELISKLISEGFVNEERFARAYAGGKFRMKLWGRLKIIQGLKLHHITPRNIQNGLSEITDEEYWATLERQAEKKWSSSIGNELQRKGAVMRYLLSKGYEQELIYIALQNLVKGKRN